MIAIKDEGTIEELWNKAGKGNFWVVETPAWFNRYRIINRVGEGRFTVDYYHISFHVGKYKFKKQVVEFSNEKRFQFNGWGK